MLPWPVLSVRRTYVNVSWAALLLRSCVASTGPSEGGAPRSRELSCRALDAACGIALRLLPACAPLERCTTPGAAAAGAAEELMHPIACSYRQAPGEHVALTAGSTAAVPARIAMVVHDMPRSHLRAPCG